jgi:tRNA pseudouridine55 synthase
MKLPEREEGEGTREERSGPVSSIGRGPAYPSSLLPPLALSGILNLDKPSGPTSHDVVAHVRRLIAGPKSKMKVGHSGTLDPAATGVLIVLLGSATRLVEYLGDLPKSYEAEIRFGLRTDSQDTTGALLSEEDASSLTETAVRDALADFRGEIFQTPPMVSAVKIGGKRLYELARRGETVERAARPVSIFELRLEEFHPGPKAGGKLVVNCSSGTYVRTLCADLGERLGCGAAMGALRRTAIGPFHFDTAITLEELERAVARDRLTELLLPPVAAVAHLPAVTVDAAEQALLLHGMAVPVRQPPSLTPGSLARVLDEGGALLAIARWESKLVPVKVLAATRGDELRGGDTEATGSTEEAEARMEENNG